ncbi:hypothetical protein AI27_17810 [Sphingomonas sp. BHC-A]|nr:hypothetical protein AI27_17810 [Sphingomonas sp. BHC-A]
MAILARLWPHLLAVAAVLGAIWYVDQRGYERARKDERLDQLEQRATIDKLLRDSEGRLATIVGRNDRQLADQIAAVRTYRTTVIQPTIEREIANDTRLADPSMRISDSLLRSINAARVGSACARRIDGGIECALPAAAADQRSDGGNAGAGGG